MDTANATLLHRYKSVESEILCLSKLAAGPLLISGTSDGLVYAMDVRTCSFYKALRSHQERVLSVSATGIREHEIVSGGQDGTICIWDSRTFKKLTQVHAHDSAVSTLDVIHKTIFSASWDESILAIDFEQKTRSRLCIGTALKHLPEGPREHNPCTPFQSHDVVVQVTASPRKNMPSTCPGLFAWTLRCEDCRDTAGFQSTSYIHDVYKAHCGSVRAIKVRRVRTPPTASSEHVHPMSLNSILRGRLSLNRHWHSRQGTYIYMTYT